MIKSLCAKDTGWQLPQKLKPLKSKAFFSCQAHLYTTLAEYCTQTTVLLDIPLPRVKLLTGSTL